MINAFGQLRMATLNRFVTYILIKKKKKKLSSACMCFGQWRMVTLNRFVTYVLIKKKKKKIDYIHKHQ